MEALKAALIPITNSLFAVGLVSLPGMMTGQILGGSSPVIAIKYQIMIMLAIFVGCTINLVVSINQPEMTLRIRSDIYYMLWKVFEENGVVIPFPQRDLNMGDGWDKFTDDLQSR